MKLSLPNKMTSDDSPNPPPMPLKGRRLTDQERQDRRTELGIWSNHPRTATA
jgi:hypothetical protein